MGKHLLYVNIIYFLNHIYCITFLTMLSPEFSIFIMFIASCIIGYITMPIILGLNSPYTKYHTTKLLSSILMGLLMAIVELFMHSMTLSIPRTLTYFSILWLGVVIITYLIQQQTFVSENDFLNGMIEHHAMGIEMAKHFTTYNKYLYLPSQKTLHINKIAQNIVNSQSKEITEMDALLSEKK